MPPKKEVNIRSDDPLVKELIKHNVELEKVSIELIDSVNEMTSRMDRMLSLFEEAAKNLERKEILQEKPVAKQIESLLEQNKIIARGLLLIEKYIREKTPIGFAPSTMGTKPPDNI